MRRAAAVVAAGNKTSNRHRNSPRHRWRRPPCQKFGHGWKTARSYASRAMISPDISSKSPTVRVIRHRDKRPTATPSGSRQASKSWLATVRHAPKSSRPTSRRRLGGPIAICHRPRHLLSPKAPARGNDATGFVRRRRRVTRPRRFLRVNPPRTPTPSRLAARRGTPTAVRYSAAPACAPHPRPTPTARRYIACRRLRRRPARR
jgi:hypothetical protein